eukprot:6802903-Prymnesium_polylepis.1
MLSWLGWSCESCVACVAFFFFFGLGDCGPSPGSRTREKARYLSALFSKSDGSGRVGVGTRQVCGTCWQVLRVAQSLWDACFSVFTPQRAHRHSLPASQAALERSRVALYVRAYALWLRCA